MLSIYRASAGSGKTFNLARDYITLLHSNTESGKIYRRILAVTFTNKATEEMKSRILKELHALSSSEDSKYRDHLIENWKMSADQVNRKAGELLASILNDYSSFSISTIDKFFQQIIRAFAREIGVNGAYQLELDNAQVLDQATDNLFIDLDLSEHNQLIQWLTQFAEEEIEKGESWNLRRQIQNFGYEIFKESYQHKAEQTKEKLREKSFLNNYKGKLNQIVQDYEKKLKIQGEKALTILNQYGLVPEDFVKASASPVRKLRTYAQGKPEYLKTFSELAEDVQKCYAKKTDPGTKTRIEDAYANGLQECFIQINKLIEEEIIPYNSARIVLRNLHTLGILTDLAIEVRKLTADENIMLISDSNLLLNQIIDNSESPFIYEKTGVRIDHYLIDEFQDTSSLQWLNFKPLILNSLSAGYDNLLVGDIKQSIYRWRNSDWMLLKDKVYKDLAGYDIVNKNLQVNYRSEREIIEFNNQFFPEAATCIQDYLNELLSPVLEQIPELCQYTEIVRTAYEDVQQDFTRQLVQGHVRFEIIDKEEESTEEESPGWKQLSLNRLAGVLEDLQDRNFIPSKVGILVRTNQEESMVIDHLLRYKNSQLAKENYSYAVMGNEGLKVESASSVRFILGIIKLMNNPQDKIQRTISSFEYCQARLKMNVSEAMAMSLRVNEGEDWTVTPFAAKDAETLKEIRNMSLFEMTETLIDRFELTKWNNEAAFLQAFQDIIFRYSISKSADLNSFLVWWEKFGEKQYIQAPDNKQAFRIMTVHRAKGLDFDAVIMPFCDWDLDSTKSNTLWCGTNVAPFNELPLIPVNYQKELAQSVFAPSFFQEKMQVLMDNLNVTYVAFTRAKYEMIGFMPKMNPAKQTGKRTMSKMASLIQDLFEKGSGTGLKGVYDSNNGIWQSGSKMILKPEDRADNSTDSAETAEKTLVTGSATTGILMSDYPSVPAGTRLKVKHGLHRFNDPEELLLSDPITHGSIMHEILCRIQSWEDEKEAIESMVREGQIGNNTRSELEKEVQEFKILVKDTDWFDTSYKVLNEKSILTPDGEFYRPDRVILKDGIAKVIDYKFGKNKKSGHEKQIRNYQSLLQQMGYQTEAHLCYVSLRELIELT